MIQRHVLITGKVQGVGFRAGVFNQAMILGGLRGWVRNLDTGQVEAVFCGEEQIVFKMIQWCNHGPSSSEVQEVKVSQQEPDAHLSSFAVR